MRIKKIFVVILLMNIFKLGYSEELTIEQLKSLRDKHMITDEDYNILLADLTGTLENKNLYKLSVNGNLLDDKFTIISKGDKLYFPLFKFIDTLDFFDKKQKGDLITYSIKDGFSFEVDKHTKTISLFNLKRFNEKTVKKKEWLIENKDEYYIREDIFQDIFLKSLTIEKNNLSIDMRLAFNTPVEASILFRVRQEELLRELSKNELLYTNEKKFFEWGDIRVKLNENISKSSKSSKYKKDWDGGLEYQGVFLYGSLNSSYDIKNKTLRDINLKYKNIFNEHDLTIGNYGVGNNSREFGFNFRKNKGYFELGKKFIIKESVPIGSKVELFYMGYAIDSKNAINGEVIFDNPLLKSNRSYSLKIYSANGDVETRYINTVQNYNQQNKGEIEYNIDWRENKISNSYKWDSSIYYGITNRLTLGIENRRKPTFIKGGYKFLDEGRMELIYSDSILGNRYPLTLKFGNDRTLSRGEDNGNRDYRGKYKYDKLMDLTINRWKLKIEQENYGKYYDYSEKQKYDLEYNGFENLVLGYTQNRKKYREDKNNIEQKYRVGYDKGITSNLLLSSEANIDDKGNKGYRADLYYTGLSRVNISLRNKWNDNFSEYETEFELRNNKYSDELDYSVGVSYSERYKEKVRASFSLKLDKFFKINSSVESNGNRNIGIGIDRVIDLKNISKPVDNIDSSRVKVIAFVDENDNNIYDEKKERVNNVEIELYHQKQVTDKNGEAMFYGIPNNEIMNISPIIRKPSYTLGNNVIKIKGTSSSTIVAYLPIKPMLTLEGNIEIGKSMNVSEERVQDIYNDILIRLKDNNGREVELTMPDETGYFVISDLKIGEYTLEAKYLGESYKIPEIKERLKLEYSGESSRKLMLYIDGENMVVDKNFGGGK